MIQGVVKKNVLYISGILSCRDTQFLANSPSLTLVVSSWSQEKNSKKIECTYFLEHFVYAKKTSWMTYFPVQFPKE